MIANTLSITVAQRSREFATLRTMGATSRQVRWAVILEGSRHRAPRLDDRALRRPRAREGARRRSSRPSASTLPQTGLVFATRTVDRLARRRHGRDARREPLPGAARDARAADRRGAGGIGAAALTASPVSARCGGDSSVCASRSRSSASARFASGIATGPRLLLLGVGVLGALPRRRDGRTQHRAAARLRARLARDAASAASRARSPGSNAMRNPGRTASTAAALMIGLALVSAVAVLAQGLKQSVVGSVHQRVPRRLRPHLRERLHADLGRLGRPRCARRASRPSSPASAPGDGRAFGQTIQVAGLDPGPRHAARCSTGSKGSNAAMATLGAQRRDRRQQLREQPPPRRRLADLRSRRPPAARSSYASTRIFTPPEAENPLGTVSISSRRPSTRSTRTPRTSSR